MPIRDQIAAWRLAYNLDPRLSDEDVIATFAAIECRDAIERLQVITACRLRLEMPPWLEQIVDALGDATRCYEAVACAPSVEEQRATDAEAERLSATAMLIFLEHFGDLATAPLIYAQLVRGLTEQLAEAKARAKASTKERGPRARSSRWPSIH